MDTLILLIGVALLLVALKAHAFAQANVIKKVDRQWFERLFTGSRASIDNLTEKGQRYRKQSNLYAVCGLAMIGVYLLVKNGS